MFGSLTGVTSNLRPFVVHVCMEHSLGFWPAPAFHLAVHKSGHTHTQTAKNGMCM